MKHLRTPALPARRLGMANDVLRMLALSFGACVAVLSSTSSHAALIQRTGLITDVQIESHERPAGRADVVWVKIPGAWPGTTCTGDWAWFNAKTSSQLLAGALAARATGSTAIIYVDDSLPKLETYCQVAILTM